MDLEHAASTEHTAEQDQHIACLTATLRNVQAELAAIKADLGVMERMMSALPIVQPCVSRRAFVIGMLAVLIITLAADWLWA